MGQPLPTTKNKSSLDFLNGGGEMGRRIREYDWATTSIGQPEFWPQSLRTCIRIMLDSRQPIWIGWGKEWIKFYNDPYLSIIGGKHPWALGKPASVVWKDIWGDIGPMLQQVENGKGTYVESQLLIMERNGYPEETYYTFSYTPVLNDDGSTAGMFCANTDDTDRIVSERQLKTLTELGKALIDCKSETTVVEASLHTLSGNPHDFPFALFYTCKNNKAVLTASTSLQGYEMNVPKEIDLKVENEISALLNTSAATQRMQVLEDLQKKLGGMPKGAWEVSPDKTIILPILQSSKEAFGFLVVGINPYRLLDENYSGFFTLVADQISTALADVFALEQERKRSEALAEIDRAKTAFFTNISHEFRTPLTLMLGTLEEALNDSRTNAYNLKRLDVTHRNAMRLLKLVNSLLDFSRIEAGKMKARFTKVDINAFTADLASTFRSAMDAAGLQFHINVDAGTEPVYVDKEMWEKIVLNLLSNAFKYTLEGSVTVSLSSQDKQVVFKVKDTGVGIPEKELPKMFQRFHRVENLTGRSFEGSGIGLSLVSELVKQHGGQITVSSQQGVGSEFTVTIPAGRDHLPAEHVAEKEEDFETRHTHAFIEEASTLLESNSSIINEQHLNNAATVLVVDDNADMRTYIKSLLQSQYHVLTANNGREALELVKSQPPQLIVSDVMMPVMDGVQLLENIKQDSTTRNIPVLLVSARAGEEAKIEGFDLGADDYLVKPFSAKELLARVRSQINISQIRYKTIQDIYRLFDEVPFAVAVLKGEDLRIEFINQYNLKIWQRSREDVIGKPLFEARPDIRITAEPVHRQVYETGRRFVGTELPFEWQTDGGTEMRYFNTVIDPLVDEHNETVGQIASSIEVTDQVIGRKKAEESETELHSFLMQVPAGIAILDGPEHVFILANEGYQKTFGRSADELVGKSLRQAFPESEGQEFYVLLDKIYRSGEKVFVPELTATLNIHQQTATRYYDCTFEPLSNENGKTSRIMVMVVDVTEKVLARQRLEESEREFSTMANVMPQLVWIAGSDGVVSFYNDRVEEFAGAKKTADGWYWDGMVHPDDREPTINAWNQSVRTGQVYTMEHRIRMQDGKYRWFLSRAFAQKNEEGEITKWFGTATDIHDQKTLTEKLEALVVERTKELQRSNEDLQQFAHVASHDLKEPVRKVMTFGNRLKEEIGGQLSEKANLYLSKIEKSAIRMYSMIDGVLLYSSLNALEQTKELIDLDELVQNIESDLEVSIAEKGATVKYQNLPTIEASPILIYQLFYNLINNSLKFAKAAKAPVIEISSTPANPSEILKAGLPEKKDFIKIILQDNGIGFENESSEMIFGTFTRLHAKDKYEGTGLGLALCRKIVERHGGAIYAQGKPDEGASFTILFPA